MTLTESRWIEDHIIYDDKGGRWRIVRVKEMQGNIKNSFMTWNLARAWLMKFREDNN